MGTKSSNKIAVIAALTTLWPTVASPQGGAGNPGGVQLDFGIDTSLKVDDNFQLSPVSRGTSTISDTTLTFGFSNITPTQQLLLNGSTVLRYADIPGRSTTGLEDPQLRLTYNRDASNSRLSVTARYRNVDREFLDPFQVEAEEQQLGIPIDTGGTLENIGATVTYQTGINDPIGFILGATYDDKDYTNVTSTRLFDNTTSSLSVAAQLRPSQVTQVQLSAKRTNFDTANATSTSRVTMDYSLGLTQDIDPVTVMTASIGYTEVETEDIIAATPVITRKSGATGSLGLTRTVADGTYTANLSTNRNVNGARTTLRFGRTLQLPNGGLSALVGATRGDNGNIDWVASLSYNTALKSSTLGFRLDRAAFTNNADEDILDTRIGVTYGHEIDNISRVDVSLNWGRSEDGGAGAAPTIERATLKATYTRALTSDWNMTGGVQLRTKDDSTLAGSADSKAVFLTLGRNFSFRP